MQRSVASICIVILFGVFASCDSPASRQGIAVDLRSFPQATPKDALTSVVKAAEAKQIDYLLAQLADPDWVDNRVEAEGFKELVQEAKAKLDSLAVKQLRRFLLEGEIETLDTRAVVRHKDVKDRVVRLRRIDKRWYLMHTNRP